MAPPKQILMKGGPEQMEIEVKIELTREALQANLDMFIDGIEGYKEAMQTDKPKMVSDIDARLEQLKQVQVMIKNNKDVNKLQIDIIE